ncbi:ParB/RepB/Spo0J family partition protein [Neorickettsia helminthoeca]|nr:ParB/RepB/Spo0J family partition protein [Neorickettsia helminthoeca]
MLDEIVNLNTDEIDANENQPRRSFDEASLLELSESIKKNGIVQPIVVRRKGNRYQLVVGERRLRAAKKLGLKVIPGIIKEFTDQSSLEIAIIENVQREDLNSIDEAIAYNRLIEEFKYTHEEVASIVGRSRSYITNHVRILSLPDNVKILLRDKKISLGHAKLLISVENNEYIADEVVRLSLNVRQTEDLIRKIINKKQSCSDIKKSSELLMLERKVSERLGMRVVITDTNGKYGSVKVTFKNLDELRNVLERLSQ